MSNGAVGERWEDVRRELFSEEEIAASSLRVDRIGEIVRARREPGLTTGNDGQPVHLTDI